MLMSAIPVIAVSNSAYNPKITIAESSDSKKKFAYRPDPAKQDPCYMGVSRDNVWMHLQSFKTDRAGKTDAFIWVADVDEVHKELSSRGAAIQLPPTNQTWGDRELGVRDPDEM